MKLKPSELKIGQKYFLIDFDKDEVVEGMFVQHSLYLDRESYDFKHSITIDKDGDELSENIYLVLKNGVLEEACSSNPQEAWVENPIFLTKEAAENGKKDFILASLVAVRELILKELEENTNNINRIKGE